MPQKQVRLSEEQQAELVARHEAGVFKKELARVYGIHVETVQAIIRPGCKPTDALGRGDLPGMFTTPRRAEHPPRRSQAEGWR